MANHTTGAQRYNNKMDKIFAEAKRLQKDPVTKSYRRHQRNIGVAEKDKGSQYPGAKKLEVAKKMKPTSVAKDRADWHKTAADFHKMSPAQAQKKYGAYGANNK